MTYHRYAIRTLTAIAVAIFALFVFTDDADAMTLPPDLPGKVMHTLPKVPTAPADQHCTDDEFGYWVREDLVICVHIEGDGWRPVEVDID